MLIVVKGCATPAGTAMFFLTESEAAGTRAEAPGLSEAREKAEVVPAESAQSVAEINQVW